MYFRFIIRYVLWLTAVVALATGCWLEHRNNAIEWSRVRVQMK
jgi:hypothetical protein